MLPISRDDERFVEKDLLGFTERDSVPFPVLVDIPIVPLETRAILEKILGIHRSSISQAYTRMELGKFLRFSLP
jgi:hypothetical protein